MRLSSGNRSGSESAHDSLANEESRRTAAVLEAFPALGVAARSWTAAHPWEQLLEMSGAALRRS
jgi:hypothetical protein